VAAFVSVNSPRALGANDLTNIALKLYVANGQNNYSIDATGDALLRDNVIIGDGTAGVDYTLTFDGEDNDGC